MVTFIVFCLLLSHNSDILFKPGHGWVKKLKTKLKVKSIQLIYLAYYAPVSKLHSFPSEVIKKKIRYKNY